MPIDMHAVELEAALWKPTGELRWFREATAMDWEARLDQLWERITGERQWRPIPTVLGAPAAG